MSSNPVSLATPPAPIPTDLPGPGALPPALLEALEALQAANPEHADVLRDAWSKVRNRERTTPEHRLSVICRKLREGCTTVAELVDETGWKKADVMTDLLHLIDADMVEERKAKDDKCNVGRGGRVRYYFLRDAAAFAPVIGVASARCETAELEV
jgi:hypothetical protein